METILNFLKENPQMLWGTLIFLFGWLLPVPRFEAFGRQAGDKLPPKVRKMLEKRLRALQRGLENSNVKGDINLVDNNTVREEFKRTRLDLGLKE